MLRQFGRRSIYVRLILFTVTIIAISTAFQFLFVYTVLDRDVREMAVSHQLTTAAYIAKDVDDKITLRLDFLRVAAGQFPPGAERSVEQARRWLDGNVSYRLIFPAGLALYDANGAQVAETAARGGQPADISQEKWFQAALKSRGPLIAKLYRTAPDADPFMTMAAAIRGPDGAVAAIITGTTAVLEENFLKPVYEQKIGEAGGVLVIDPDANIIITSSNRPQLLAPAAPPGVNSIHDKARAGWRGVGETTAASGRHVLSAIVSIPAAGWFLVAHQPTDQAYRPVWKVERNLLVVSTVIIGGTLVGLYLLLNYMLGPLSEAARRLHAMARQDAPVDFLTVRRDDEIGQMVTGFNSLLTTLREREDELRENEALMQHMAHHDALTGLPNLQLFRDRLRQSLGYAERNAGSLAVLYLDLDRFKPINDTYGHHIGDAVLKEVAGRVSGVLRKNDTFARIGGDEFAIILADAADKPEQADSVVEKCRKAITQPMSVEGLDVSVGVSIGIAHFPADGATEAELVQAADNRMYQAKRSRH
jgi:diguanylate cyclase (GGDEF)-like protein